MQLDWLINPQDRQVKIYRSGQEAEALNYPVMLSGEDVLPGFELMIRWAAVRPGDSPSDDSIIRFRRSNVDYLGQCLCGAIQYKLTGIPNSVALCHCKDCRRSAGAPAVVWAMFPESSLSVTKGRTKTINSSGGAMRTFCADCGSGLFYRNAENLPGLVDVQTSTLDDPDALPPTLQIQVAERLQWMKHVHELPEIERYPS